MQLCVVKERLGNLEIREDHKQEAITQLTNGVQKREGLKDVSGNRVKLIT